MDWDAIGIFAILIVFGVGAFYVVFSGRFFSNKESTGWFKTFLNGAEVVIGCLMLLGAIVWVIQWLGSSGLDAGRAHEKGLRGAVVGVALAALVGVVWLIRAILRKAGRTAAKTLPHVQAASQAASQAVGSAVHEMRKSPLERRLDEIESLYAAGKISAEERASARSAALGR